MDLKKWMVKNVPENGLDPARVISEFVPFFSSAIQQMQDKGIAHNDLHSGNILQCGDVWKVTDFDLAQRVKPFDRRGTQRDLKKVGNNLNKLTGKFKSNDHPFALEALQKFILKLFYYEIKTIWGFNREVKKVLQSINP